MTVADAKRALRAAAKVRRRAAHRELGESAGARVRDHFGAAVPVDPDAVVGGYWPLDEELDSVPLLHRLHGLGHVLGLPAVTGRGQPLAFRRWRPGTRLIKDAFGVATPAPEAETVEPSLFLVPLLAFDRRGYRLGYGGGYYDRTLRARRRDGAAIAVGLAYGAQEVEDVPSHRGDQRLDWVVTETGAFRTAGAFRTE